MPEVQVNTQFAGKRLDQFLALQPEIPSRSRALKLIKEGNVTLNGEHTLVTPKLKIKTGDIVGFTPIQNELLELEPVPHDLDIVFEDEDIIVINKPRGMVVHPAPGHEKDTLINYLLYHNKLSALNDTVRPGIVHRIDKDTSGILVVTKNEKAMVSLAEQFSSHSVKRLYNALVWGSLSLKSGTIDQPIGRHPVNRKKWAVNKNGRPSVTHWKVLKKYPLVDLLECSLETGRTHQIRVHMNSIGHSLVGDPVYGRARKVKTTYPEELVTILQHFQGQALHAKSLGFKHPSTAKWMEFDSDFPSDMQELLNLLENFRT